MPLYRRQTLGVWYYEFVVAGKRYRRSTQTADRAAAQAIEEKARVDLTASLSGPTPSTSQASAHVATPWMKSIIRAGRTAWKVAATEQNRLPNKLSTPTDRRQRWRQIGDALLLGRTISPDPMKFKEWCINQRLEIDGPTRVAAVWYAQNWEAVDAIAGNVSHPLKLRHLAMSGKKTESDLVPKPTQSE